MKGKGDKWFTVIPKNIPIVKCHLGDTAVEYLWKRIEEAKVKKKSASNYLAGNIKESLYLEDENDYFFKKHLEFYCQKYILDNPDAVSFRNSFSNVKAYKLIMQEFWVNFSEQTEFNPLHSHGGALSFVVWMKIPTRFQEQHDLPISKNTSLPSSSDFMFTYTDILGTIRPMTWTMSPEVEGMLVLFPSILAHQVYPFYNCTEERISISGNIYFDIDILRDKSGVVRREYNDRGVPLHDNVL